MSNNKNTLISGIASLFLGTLVLALGSQSASSQTLNATIKHISTTITNNTLHIDVAGVPVAASWTVGMMAVPGISGAKLDGLQADLTAMKSMRQMSNLSGIGPETVSASPGYFGVTIPQGSTQSFGAFIRVPPGTEVALTVNGKVQSDNFVTSSIVLQDGTLRHDDLKSFQQFLSIMQMPETSPAPDLMSKGGKYYTSYAAARSHLSSVTKPNAITVGCCGAAIRILLDISVDKNGNVTGVKRLSGASANVGELETVVGTWKFAPFLHNNVPVAIEVLAPIVYANNSVGSPLF